MRRGFSGLRTLGWLVVVLMLVMAVMPTAVVAADGDVQIEQDSNTNGCNGVVTTPGSENTDKQLIGGSLEPGGTARFLITYPVDPEDVAGREEFACHKSQYTPTEMAAVNAYLQHAWNGTVWLRPFTGTLRDPNLFTK